MQDGPIPAGLDMQVAVTLEKPVRGFLQKNPRPSGRGAVSSDISGQDIKPHNNEPSELTKVVRDWLRNASDRKGIPDGDFIFERYQAYKRDLPKMADMFNLNANKLIFNDYTWMVVEWLRTKENRLSQHIEGGD